MRDLLAMESFTDAESFADLVLQPCLAQGVNTALLTSFIPSYVVKLLGRLVHTTEIEPGHVDLVIVLDSSHNLNSPDTQWLAEYFKMNNIFGSRGQKFLADILSLTSEGSLSISVLVAEDFDSIAPGCVGYLESKSGDIVLFQDRLPGDNNSPIRPVCSWDEAKKNDHFVKVFGLIQDGFFGNLAEAARVPQDEFLGLVRDVVAKKWLMKSFEPKKERPRSFNAIPKKPKPKTQRIHELDDELDDAGLDYEGAMRWAREGSVESIIRGIEDSGLDGETYVSAIWGEESSLVESFFIEEIEGFVLDEDW